LAVWNKQEDFIQKVTIRGGTTKYKEKGKIVTNKCAQKERKRASQSYLMKTPPDPYISKKKKVENRKEALGKGGGGLSF